jgi:hypothetical protein
LPARRQLDRGFGRPPQYVEVKSESLISYVIRAPDVIRDSEEWMREAIEVTNALSDEPGPAVRSGRLPPDRRVQ